MAINSIKLQGIHLYIVDINFSENLGVKTCSVYQSEDFHRYCDQIYKK